MAKKEVFGSGMRFVIEEIPHFSSVCIGIWVENGSRREEKNVNGISHFIEHMVFKGTKSRSALEIAKTMDRVGGRLNAFTSKELTCFHVTVLKDHLELGLDLLSDLVFNALFGEDAIEKEKGVVIEEINFYEDTPSEHIGDLFVQTIFPDSPLGQPISGIRDVIHNLTRAGIVDYFNSCYYPANFIVSIAGNIDSAAAKEKVISFLEKNSTSAKNNAKPNILPKFTPNVKMFEKELNQVHLCLGTPGIRHDSAERYAFSILNLIFGGSMSSRLFQKVREEHGLVYAVGSYSASYKDTGYECVYAGTDTSNFLKVVELTLEEIKKLREDGITEDELKMAKENIKGNLLLGLESTDFRMNRIAISEIYLGKLVSTEEVMDRVYSVKMEDVRSLAMKYMKPEDIAAVAIGPGLSEGKVRDLLVKIK